MSINNQGRKIKVIYKGSTKFGRVYKGEQIIFGTKFHDVKTFTASGSFIFPNRLISLTITVVGGGGASGGWSNDRHGWYTPKPGQNGGKAIHSLSNAIDYSNKTVTFIVGDGGKAGAQAWSGKFNGFYASTKGGDSSVPLFNLVATGGYQGWTAGNPQSTDNQPGTASGGNTFNGVSTDAYPANGGGAPISSSVGAGINGVVGKVVFDYYYWE